MPEMPEVETVRRGLAPVMEGKRIAAFLARRKDLRWKLPADLAAYMTGRRVLRIGRRAKYLIVELDGPRALIVHLGMSGRLFVDADPGGPLDPHDHVVIDMEGGRRIVFNDARRFGMIDLHARDAVDSHWLLAGLGPEPLSDAFDGAALARSLQGRKTPIKAALLDQRVVAGLGNIYVSEALFEAGISPRRLARAVRGERAERLARAIKAVLARAIAAGGSSLRDYVQPSGELGYFQHQWAVYDKAGQPCPGCDCAPRPGRGIRRIVQTGRSTFYCPRRQR
jgi:formamidopyrimidine-DNA glycosylase